MKLREAIRTIVREVVGEDIRRIVREILVEELMDADAPAPREKPDTAVGRSPRSAAAVKAAATRAANRAAGKLPKAAQRMGLALGQKWKGKPYNKRVADRIIEVAVIDATGVIPKIVVSSKKKTAAKHISFDHLRGSYDKYSGPVA